LPILPSSHALQSSHADGEHTAHSLKRISSEPATIQGHVRAAGSKPVLKGDEDVAGDQRDQIEDDELSSFEV
jgi:hypothetical protein